MTGPTRPSPRSAALTKVGRVARGRTGTRVRYWPDRQIFLPDAQLSWSSLVARARQTSFAGAQLALTDQRASEHVTEVFKHDGGISEFCDFLAGDAPVTDVLRLQDGTDTFTETVPMLDTDGAMTPTDVDRTLEVDIALRWGAGYDSTVQSFVNIIATPKGGTRAGGSSGAPSSLRQGTRRHPAAQGRRRDRQDDILEGMTGVVTVRLAEPQFEGQTKEVLGTPPVTRLVAKPSAELGVPHLEPRRAAPQARAVMEKVVSASRTRVAARAHKENQRRKNALESSSLPAKLADCRNTDNERSELFMFKGDSAMGTAGLNSEFQALPIRGKILNVQRASVGDMLKNASARRSFRWWVPVRGAPSNSSRPATAR